MTFYQYQGPHVVFLSCTIIGRPCGVVQRSSTSSICAFDQMRCAADQLINCAVFDDMRNVWPIAQRFFNSVGIRVRSRVKGLGLGFGLAQDCGQFQSQGQIRPNAQRVWSNVQVQERTKTYKTRRPHAVLVLIEECHLQMPLTVIKCKLPLSPIINKKRKSTLVSITWTFYPGTAQWKNNRQRLLHHRDVLKIYSNS